MSLVVTAVRFRFQLRSRAAALLLVAGCASAGADVQRGTGHGCDLPLRGGSVPWSAALSTTSAETTLHEAAADVTLIVLWGTFCEPCLRELPWYDELHRGYRSEPRVRILAVALDRPAVAEQRAREVAPGLPVYTDADYRVAWWMATGQPERPMDLEELTVPVLPAAVLVSRKREVVQCWTGFDPAETRERFVERYRSAIRSALSTR